MTFKNKVKKQEFEYEEEVRDFTGLVFHCPNCDEVFHLHIATVRVEESQKSTENIVNPKDLHGSKSKAFQTRYNTNLNSSKK